MKIKIQLLTILLLSFISIGIKAQEIACDAFCVTEVRMDTTAPNLMYVTLFFTGDNNEFINYPWISEVINEQGDTVGHGTWNFFGQFGNTSTDYPVKVDFDAIPDNFRAEMIFHYDTSVCLLTFPCTTGIEDPIKNEHVRVYPNPFSTETNVYSENHFNDLTIKIFDLRGQMVKQVKHQNGTKISLQRDDLLDGIYFIQLIEGKRNIGIRKVIVVE
ncbi:MAG: T9SS type A sorting domain-containing protein [Saprospiraceae bacterium]